MGPNTYKYSTTVIIIKTKIIYINTIACELFVISSLVNVGPVHSFCHLHQPSHFMIPQESEVATHLGIHMRLFEPHSPILFRNLKSFPGISGDFCSESHWSSIFWYYWVIKSGRNSGHLANFCFWGGGARNGKWLVSWRWAGNRTHG